MKPILVVQNCEGESPGSFVDFLNERRLTYTVLHNYKNHDFPEVSSISAVISLGTPISVRDSLDHDHLRALHRFTAEAVRADLPYLGICFGGQMLAKVLGARVEKADQKEIGFDHVGLTEPGLADPLFAGFEERVPVFQWHGDTFRVPFGATQLAEGEVCRNQAFRKGNAVALQFHLEATPDEVARYCELYSEELAEVDKTKDQIINEFEPHAATLRDLNRRLLHNFTKPLSA